MANLHSFTASNEIEVELSTPSVQTNSTPAPITASIHSANKTSNSSGEKPAIAARPVPPPMLPKYSSCYAKGDKDHRMEFGKLERADTNKEPPTSSSDLTTSFRHSNLERLSARQRMLDKNGAMSVDSAGGGVGGGGGIVGGIPTTLQLKREMFFKSEVLSPQSAQLNNATSTNATTTMTMTMNNNSGAPTPLTGNNNTDSIQNNKTTNVTGIGNSGTGETDANLPATGKYPPFGKSKEMTHALKQNQDSNKMASERESKVKLKELDGYVGFANLPNQVYRKAVKKGFEFTLMVVGASGLGKSTLINTMFLADIYNQDQYPGPSQRIKKTLAVETTKVLLKEGGVNLSLTVVDTPGFGDAVDNSNCWVPIINFVESKFEEFLTCESRVHRKAAADNRVHCCLYFIAPSGHGLKPLDIEFMEKLCDKVNIIPVIAKADTMTPEEIQFFKKQVLNEIAQHKIRIYDFPDPLEDEEEAKSTKLLKGRVPFAVVGANAVLEIDGKKVRGRKYPWGIAEVENLDHCDFIALRNMVIRTHLQDLKDVTNNVHYENYRFKKLAGLGVDGKQPRLNNKNPIAQMEEEKHEHELKLKKMEAEMEQVFEMKVKGKKQKLKDSENELARRHEERKKGLEMLIRELDERRRAFEEEKKDWEDSNGITLDELRRRSLEANSKETMDGKEKKDKKKKGLF